MNFKRRQKKRKTKKKEEEETEARPRGQKSWVKFFVISKLIETEVSVDPGLT